MAQRRCFTRCLLKIFGLCHFGWATYWWLVFLMVSELEDFSTNYRGGGKPSSFFRKVILKTLKEMEISPLWKYFTVAFTMLLASLGCIFSSQTSRKRIDMVLAGWLVITSFSRFLVIDFSSYSSLAWTIANVTLAIGLVYGREWLNK